MVDCAVEYRVAAELVTHLIRVGGIYVDHPPEIAIVSRTHVPEFAVGPVDDNKGVGFVAAVVEVFVAVNPVVAGDPYCFSGETAAHYFYIIGQFQNKPLILIQCPGITVIGPVAVKGGSVQVAGDILNNARLP